MDKVFALISLLAFTLPWQLFGREVYLSFQHSTMCLELSPTNRLVQSPCNQLKSQIFSLEPSGQGIKEYFGNYSLKVGNRCLSADAKNAVNGAELFLTTCNDKLEQKFRITPSSDDFLYSNIENVGTSKCLDVFEQQYEAGANIHLWSCADYKSQRIYISPIPKQKQSIPHIIWTFWDKGEDSMPAFYKVNVQVWRERLPKDWRVIVLNTNPSSPNFFSNYLGPEANILSLQDIEAKIVQNPQGYQKLNAAVVFSDILRLEVLHKHGGFWIDPSVMLHSDLSEFTNVLDNLDGFQLAGYTSKVQATQNMRWADSLENFFLAALPGSSVVKEWRSNFRRYWDLKSNLMAIENHPMYDGSEGLKLNPQDKFKGIANYLNQHVALKYTLIKNPSLLEHIFIRSGVNADDKGPFTLLELAKWDDNNLVTMTNEAETSETMKAMSYVLISKFPSKNSAQIRQKMPNISDFFDQENIFRRLNRQPNPKREKK